MATLTETGWAPGRRVPTDDLEQALSADGFTVHDAALEVLGSFAGLTVRPPVRGEAVFASGDIVFDPLWAAEGESGRINERASRLGAGLCPVGEWSGEYVLLVADDAQFYAETTFQFFRVGRSLDDALRRLIRADSAPEHVVVG